MSRVVLPSIENDWEWRVLVKMFPANWRVLAKSTRAMTRSLRNFADEESVMRALLLHLGCGHSLRETAALLKRFRIAEVSDVALLKRLRCSELWFKALCRELLKEKGLLFVKEKHKERLRLVGNMHVQEPGKTGCLYHVHYSLLGPYWECDSIQLTAAKEKSIGGFPYQKGDCVIGDASYMRAQDLIHLHESQADVLVSLDKEVFTFSQKNHKAFSWPTELNAMELESGEWEVFLHRGKQSLLGRVCAIRKSTLALEEAEEELDPYVLLFTTLPKDKYPQAAVLELYRRSWQMRGIIRRLKAIADLGHIPKSDEACLRAWFYGKILAGLLVEKLRYHAQEISPWGY